MAPAHPPTAAAPAAAHPANVTDQVSSIQLAVDKNRFATEKLHASWLGWLRTLAGLVCVLSCFQAHGPFTQCWRDEAYTYAQGLAINLTFWRTLLLAFQDSLEYWIAILHSCCLMLFLNAPNLEFNNSWKVANMCMILALAVYLMRTKSLQTSCIQYEEPSFVSPEQPLKRTLPVVIVFHVIASVCVGIMQVQKRIHRRNAAAVEKLRQDAMSNKKKR